MENNKEKLEILKKEIESMKTVIAHYESKIPEWEKQLNIVKAKVYDIRDICEKNHAPSLPTNHPLKQILIIAS